MQYITKLQLLFQYISQVLILMKMRENIKQLDNAQFTSLKLLLRFISFINYEVGL